MSTLMSNDHTLQVGMYRVQFFTGYRVPGIKTVFYRVRIPSTGYLTN